MSLESLGKWHKISDPQFPRVKNGYDNVNLFHEVVLRNT